MEDDDFFALDHILSGCCEGKSRVWNRGVWVLLVFWRLFVLSSATVTSFWDGFSSWNVAKIDANYPWNCALPPSWAISVSANSWDLRTMTPRGSRNFIPQSLLVDLPSLAKIGDRTKNGLSSHFCIFSSHFCIFYPPPFNPGIFGGGIIFLLLIKMSKMTGSQRWLERFPISGRFVQRNIHWVRDFPANCWLTTRGISQINIPILSQFYPNSIPYHPLSEFS